MPDYRVAIIGGGVLGASMAYFLSARSEPGSIALLEAEPEFASHTSGRNTGKVHAPFLYDPSKKRTFARAAYLGYDMWRDYARSKGALFKEDGVMEVATDDRSVDRLRKYMEWGEANGLGKDEMTFMDSGEAKAFEPNVRCESAVYCRRDASVDYRQLTNELVLDAGAMGCDVMPSSRARKISATDSGYRIRTDSADFEAGFVVNAAGGNAVDIAHSMGEARKFTDVHFRGEYWEAPPMYRHLTKHSVYSVPKRPEYPFLDPHWIIRADGRREVGPNAVPVFGPHSYGIGDNLRSMLPKIAESVPTGARKIFFDRDFVSMALSELGSSISKRSMIDRVRKFLPDVNPSYFTRRGTSGIRSSLVDSDGKFVPDTLTIYGDSSLHVLNYNSPGATGALPMAAMLTESIAEKYGVLDKLRPSKSMWGTDKICDLMGV